MTPSLPEYAPMLASVWPEPFTDPDWRFEIKWDGVRAVLYVDGDSVRVMSRRGNDVTGTYPEVSSVRLDQPTVLDGEIVALDESGRPSFELLQARMNLHGHDRIVAAVGRVPVSFVAFDVLHVGDPVLSTPWRDRRSLLESLDLPAPCVVSTVVENAGPLWSFVMDRGLEGIVAKRLDAPYRPGIRSPDWRKISHWLSLRAAVGGYLPGAGGRGDSFASLLLGVNTPAGLRWVGQVGTGFDDRSLRLIRTALDEMTVDVCPFLEGDVPAGAVWVDPQLVAAVRYKELTSAGRLRAPSFKGFTDANVEDITWESEFGRGEPPSTMVNPTPSSP